MVAEQIVDTTRAYLSAAMDRARTEEVRQPTLAEELDAAEKEARVTKALQAVEKQQQQQQQQQHGMLYDNVSRRVNVTPRNHRQR